MLFLYEKCVSSPLNLYSWIQYTIQYTSRIGNHHLGISSLCKKNKATNISVSAGLLSTDSFPSKSFLMPEKCRVSLINFLALKMPFHRYEINVSSQLRKIKKKKKFHKWLTWLGYSIKHLPNAPDYYTFKFALFLCTNTASAYFLVTKITNIRSAVTEFTEGLYSNNKIASPLLLPYTNYGGEGKKGQK